MVARREGVASIGLLVWREAIDVHLRADLKCIHHSVVAAHRLLASEVAEPKALEPVLKLFVQFVGPSHKFGGHHKNLPVRVPGLEFLEHFLPPLLLGEDAVLALLLVRRRVEQLEKDERRVVGTPVPVAVLPKHALPVLPLHEKLDPGAVEGFVRAARPDLPLEAKERRLVEAIHHVMVIDRGAVLVGQEGTRVADQRASAEPWLPEREPPVELGIP
mmetsp:Transcript_7260/g.17438  ORF Transcript_7260/g.17438 Transcript_7260/m.17438 type:complete len:217 (-) Transcript_7260:2460-3110(-)